MLGSLGVLVKSRLLRRAPEKREQGLLVGQPASSGHWAPFIEGELAPTPAPDELFRSEYLSHVLPPRLGRCPGSAGLGPPGTTASGSVFAPRPEPGELASSWASAAALAARALATLVGEPSGTSRPSRVSLSSTRWVARNKATWDTWTAQRDRPSKSADARAALADYLQAERPNDTGTATTALFCSAISIASRRPDGRLSTRAVNLILERIGAWHDAEQTDPNRRLGQLRPHALRHTFAFALSEETNHDAYELERRLGHRSQRYIARYTNPPEDVAASYVEGL